MEKDNYKWLDSVPNLSNERIELYIKGLLLRLTHVTDTNVLTNLNERLGALQCEAMKRGLRYE